MADKILYVKSAFKHGYTQTDIERAIEIFYNRVVRKLQFLNNFL
jgi:hypothetical protein